MICLEAGIFYSKEEDREKVKKSVAIVKIKYYFRAISGSKICNFCETRD